MDRDPGAIDSPAVSLWQRPAHHTAAGAGRWRTWALRPAACLGLLAAGMAFVGVEAGGTAAAASSKTTVYVVNWKTPTVLGFSSTANGNAKPSVKLTRTTGSPTAFNAAFDAAGNLWVALGTSNKIVEFSAAQLAAGGSQAPSVVLTGVTTPRALAFDGAGDLWVAVGQTGSTLQEAIVKLTPAELKASGHVAPPVTLKSTGGPTASIAHPQGLAFDAGGDLWVTNGMGSTVAEFSSPQLAASGSPVPKVVLQVASHTFDFPTGLAFDAAGNLWVGCDTGHQIARFSPAQIAQSGAPVPTYMFGSRTTWQIGFDATGELWAARPTTDAITGYSAAQQAAGGTPTPANLITGATTHLTHPFGLAVATPPTVTSVTPSSGNPRTAVVVTGTGFTSATTVDFGTVAATTVTVVSPFKLTAVAPPGTGTVDVTATTFAGTSATSAADHFTFPPAGYDLVGSDGGVFVFPVGQASGYFGSLPGIHVVPVAPIVGLVPTVTLEGYFLVGADGGVFSFGTAPFLGSLPGKGVKPALPIAGIVAANTDKGYFLVGKDGGVFAFGTVPFLGSLPGKGISVSNVVGIAATPTGNGYWVVSGTGSVYGFGAAKSLGTAKGTASPVAAIAGTPTGGGYWITTQNGAVYPFGNAKGFGTLPAMHVTPSYPVVGIVHTAETLGYWLIGGDGGVFAFGNAGFVGSLPGLGISVGNIVGAVPT